MNYNLTISCTGFQIVFSNSARVLFAGMDKLEMNIPEGTYSFQLGSGYQFGIQSQIIDKEKYSVILNKDLVISHDNLEQYKV